MSQGGRAVALGLAAGIIGGLFGVGGGVLVVPGLVLWLRMPTHRAAATSIAAIVVSSAAALVSFAGEGAVNWAAAAALFAGSATGAAIGVRAMSRIPAVWLTRAFVGVLMIAALRLWFR